MKYFLPTKKTIIVGMVQITAQASKSPQFVISLKLPLKMASPTGKVRMLSEFVTINGHMKLFQLDINVKIDNVAIVGSAIGKAILQNVSKMLHPSIFDDSSRSFGKLKKNCLNINTPNPPNSPGIISA